MELRHFRYFVTVAQELNFSRAAALLNVSQPALSRQIQDLEHELGLALFDRSNRQKIQLTSAGRAFLQKARAVLFESRAAADEARRWANGFNETITIAFMSAVMLGDFRRFLDPFHRRFPETAIRFTQLRSDEQYIALLEQRIDVGFVDFGPELVGGRLDRHRVETQIFLKEELCAAVPLDHPLAGRSEIHLSELRDETFAIVERHMLPAHHDTVIVACREAGFTPRIAHFAEQVPSVLTYVAARMAVCIAPRLAELSWGTQVSFIPVVGRPHIEIHMISRPDSAQSGIPALREIIAETNRFQP